MTKYGIFLLLLFASAAQAQFAEDRIYAVTTAGNLLRFTSGDPGFPSSVALSGFGVGENVVGFDIRPADVRLYVLTKNASSAGRLYSVNPTNGVVTPVVSLAPAVGDPYTALTGTRFAMDFNPTVDRLRVVSDSNQNLRVNPSTGLVITDTPLTYAAGDPNVGATPHIVGNAYSNSYAGAKLTALYNVDSGLDIAATQNPPNTGFLNTVGGLGYNTSDAVGFDLLALREGNFGYLVLNIAGGPMLTTFQLPDFSPFALGFVGGNPSIVDIAMYPEFLFISGFD